MHLSLFPAPIPRQRTALDRCPWNTANRQCVCRGSDARAAVATWTCIPRRQCSVRNGGVATLMAQVGGVTPVAPPPRGTAVELAGRRDPLPRFLRGTASAPLQHHHATACPPPLSQQIELSVESAILKPAFQKPEDRRRDGRPVAPDIAF